MNHRSIEPLSSSAATTIDQQCRRLGAVGSEKCATEDFRLSGVMRDPHGVSVKSDEFHVDARIARLSGVRDVRGGLVTLLVLVHFWRHREKQIKNPFTDDDAT